MVRFFRYLITFILIYFILKWAWNWFKKNISIDENDQMLDIVVSNSKSQHTVKRNPGGIGLMNVKKRLELLYQDRYKLAISEKINHYDVFLSIPLNQ